MGNGSSTGGDSVVGSSEADDRKAVFEEKYHESGKLGAGTFAVVRRCTRICDGSKWAVKIIDKRQLSGRELVGLKDEIRILKSMEHRNVITLTDVFDDGTRVRLVMELCTGGDLFDLILKEPTRKLDEHLSALIVFQISTALQHLHTHNVCHRDLKPENVLFSDYLAPSKFKAEAKEVKEVKGKTPLHQSDNDKNRELELDESTKIQKRIDEEPTDDSQHFKDMMQTKELFRERMQDSVDENESGIMISTKKLEDNCSDSVLVTTAITAASDSAEVSAMDISSGKRPDSGKRQTSSSSTTSSLASVSLAELRRRRHRVDCGIHSHIKISDFGLAHFMKLPPALHSMHTCCGTPHYVAPEVLGQQQYGCAVDYWSLGVMLYIMLCGYQPFNSHSIHAMYGQIMRGHYKFPSPYWDGVSKQAIRCVRKLMCVDPKRRYDHRRLAKDRWVQSHLTDSCKCFDALWLAEDGIDPATVFAKQQQSTEEPVSDYCQTTEADSMSEQESVQRMTDAQITDEWCAAMFGSPVTTPTSTSAHAAADTESTDGVVVVDEDDDSEFVAIETEMEVEEIAPVHMFSLSSMQVELL